jgi:cardiolipin synthase
LAYTGVSDDVWDEYEVSWTPRFLGEIALTAVVNQQASVTAVINFFCTPQDSLSDIGEAMATEVSPATDHCGSRFEEILIISPDDTPASPGTDGTYAFEEFANLALSAKYEVLFTSMNWLEVYQGEDEFAENQASNILFGTTLEDGIRGLYQKVSENPESYPEGMTVRILMGRPDAFNKDLILKRLDELGIPIEAPNWKLEVADFAVPGPLLHSHVKVMIVDGQTVIVGGYNPTERYFDTSDWDPLITDVGVKLSGSIAQEALNEFDALWLGAELCLNYDAQSQACDSTTTVTEATHALQVLVPPITGEGLNTFSLYRDHDTHEAEYGIYEVMSAAEATINLMQDRILYSHRVDLLRAYGNKLKHYQNGLMDALENGRTVRYIVNCESIVVGLVCGSNIWSGLSFKRFADQTPGTLQIKLPSLTADARGFLHAKTIAIDGQFLIVGNSNLDFSSWQSLLRPNVTVQLGTRKKRKTSDKKPRKR